MRRGDKRPRWTPSEARGVPPKGRQRETWRRAYRVKSGACPECGEDRPLFLCDRRNGLRSCDSCGAFYLVRGCEDLREDRDGED